MDDGRDKEREGRLKALQRQQTWALKSEDARRIHAMIDLARSEHGIAVRHEDLDADPWLLNCPNGTLDLRTGALREHRREDLITKLCPTPFDTDARCPRWEEALLKIFAGKAGLVHYFRRLCGYCLTGDVREQILPIFWGAGSNGKSLVFEAVRRVLGDDYAGTGARELLMSGDQEPHPTYLADLFGKRLVTLAETREGGRLNETLIKALTGGEKVKARRMREDYWEFAPTHKIWLASNHKPEVRGCDHGIWRRLRLVPFTVRFWDPDKGESGPPELRADKALLGRLQEEAPGILAWTVRGCLEWQRRGLQEPPEVHLATETYRDEQDLLAAFIRERCVLGQQYKCRAGGLYDAYKRWHEAAGERGKPMSQRAFGEAIEGKGFSSKKSNGVWYLGVAVKEAEPEPPWD